MNRSLGLKMFLISFSQAFSRGNASDILHNMATYKDILFWTPRGQLLRNQRTMSVTTISELVEFVLVPHNENVGKPRALDTFLDGLAELGVNDNLIKNKKLINDLLKRGHAYNDKKECDKETSDGDLLDSG